MSHCALLPFQWLPRCTMLTVQGKSLGVCQLCSSEASEPPGRVLAPCSAETRYKALAIEAQCLLELELATLCEVIAMESNGPEQD